MGERDVNVSIFGLLYMVFSIAALHHREIVIEWVNGFSGMEYLLAATFGYVSIVMGGFYVLILSAILVLGVVWLILQFSL